MTELVEHTQHAPPAPPPTGFHRLLAPGWLRAPWMTALFFFIGMGIVVGLRALAGWEPVFDWLIIVTVGALITAPIGFLAGIGAFDYWVKYCLGYPTSPEDHSGHGARSWRDYFRVNTDHKVIGVQYLVTTIFFFLAGGPDGDDLPRRAGEAGRAVPRSAGVQRPRLGPRLADDLPVRDPGLRGPRELRHPADDRRARHGVPAPERALLLAAADRRDHDALEPRRARRRLRRGLDRLRAALGRGHRQAMCGSTWASSGRGRRRS